jgi:DNA uptake protein ComE-like DNA-binding protein
MKHILTGRSMVILASIICMVILAACGAASANTQTGAVITADPASTAALAQTGSNTTQAAASTMKLNLNTATSADIQAIPGLPSRMVKEFEEYRPYASILQFRKEIGKYVSADQVAQYEQYVYVPISANKSDEATLQQIAGLDAGEAAALIAERPYASNEAFLAKLAQYVTSEQLSAAQAMLSSQ